MKTTNYSNKLIQRYEDLVSKRHNKDKYFKVLVLYSSVSDGVDQCGDFDSSINRLDETIPDLLKEVSELYANKEGVIKIEVRLFRSVHTDKTIRTYQVPVNVMFKRIIL